MCYKYTYMYDDAFLILKHIYQVNVFNIVRALYYLLNRLKLANNHIDFNYV